MNRFEQFAVVATRWSGTWQMFVGACGIVIIWFVFGPYYHWSDTYQLIINTGTTIITFLMIFLIQYTQNKDTLAIHTKLNELVAAKAGASNRLINIEELGEEQIRELHARYAALQKPGKGSGSIESELRKINDGN